VWTGRRLVLGKGRELSEPLRRAHGRRERCPHALRAYSGRALRGRLMQSGGTCQKGKRASHSTVGLLIGRCTNLSCRRENWRDMSWQRGEWSQSSLPCTARLYVCVMWAGVREESGLYPLPCVPSNG